MPQTYELVVHSSEQIIRKIGDVEEHYSLRVMPSAELSLVQESKKSILQTIQLDELFDNLENCVVLLDITYNAVNGTGLSSKVTAIKDSLSKTIDKSLVKMQGFKVKTQDSVNGFIESYDYLTNPLYKPAPGKTSKTTGVQLAVKCLQNIKENAVRMNAEAVELAGKFDEIESDAQKITKEIMDERDLDVKKKNEMENKLQVLKGRADALREVKEALDGEVSEYSEQYSKLSRQIEQNEKRAYTLSLVSAIFGGLSSVFGGGEVKNTAPESRTYSGGGNGKTSQTEQKYQESQKKVKDLEDKLKEVTEKLSEIKEKIAEEKDGGKKDELSEKQDQLTKEKKEIEGELEKARGEKEVFKNAANGISAGLSQTSDELRKMADKMDDKNVTQYDRLDRIAEQKRRLQKERRETIAQLADMTTEIQNATTESRDLELCISALITAVGCMRIVKVYLSDIALFWNNVAQFCNGLVDKISGLNEKVALFEDVEDYCEIFRTESFINAFLLNIVSWVALHSISEEYMNAFYQTRQKYQELEKVPEEDPKAHWLRAKESAKALNLKLKGELEQ